jgi:hypothetical protein
MGIRKWFLAAGVACLGLVGQASADVKLPKVFSDHMVLQRDREVPFWGWDNPGAEVKVSIGEKSASAKADKDGKWSVKLPAMKAGGPYKVTVQGSSTVNFSDVLLARFGFALASPIWNGQYPHPQTPRRKSKRPIILKFAISRFRMFPLTSHKAMLTPMVGRFALHKLLVDLPQWAIILH